jgi:AcrR family transcriptional regulator
MFSPRDSRGPMSDIAATADRRVRRTQEALHAAFRELFFARGFEAISIADIAERANVGRSTFYKHFEGKDDLLARSIGPYLEVMAEACVSAAEPPALIRVVEHFWDNRRHARTVFSGGSLTVVTRVLADHIEARLQRLGGGASGVPACLAAQQLAHAQFALLVPWLLGRGACSPAVLASGLHRSGYAAARALIRSAV